MKHLISISDLSYQEISDLLRLALKLKNAKNIAPLLNGKTLGIILEKPSTRTTVSFAVAMYQLGGLPIILTTGDLQRRRGETLADTSRTLSRYLSAVAFRTFEHNDLVEFAKNSTIPVINALTDLEHPCQVLGDILTIIEKKLNVKDQNLKLEELKKLKLVFIGDGNNVANSLMLLCAKLSLNLTVITSHGYEPDKNIMKISSEISKKTKANITVINDISGLRDADVVYTDVWTSMGKDAERKMRTKSFKRYQVNSSLLSKAKPDCIFMHCLPARRGEEVTDDVIDGKNSVVFDQAENRLHIQKAILLKLLTRPKRIANSE